MLSCARLGDGDAVAGTVPQIGAGVPWSGASAGMVDRPSKRQRTRDKPPDWVGGGSEGSLGAPPRQEPGCGEVEPPGPRTARWIGLSKRRAAVGSDRAGRSSRPSRSGQRPTGASLDALLLLPSPRAESRREDRVLFVSHQRQSSLAAPHPGPLPALSECTGEVGDARGRGRGRGSCLTTAAGRRGGRGHCASRCSAGR